jgi:hypothetical protein
MLSELLLIALIPLAALFLILLFLLVAYLRGGKEDLRAAADAVHKVRSTVGVAAAVRAFGETLRTIRRPS